MNRITLINENSYSESVFYADYQVQCIRHDSNDSSRQSAIRHMSVLGLKSKLIIKQSSVKYNRPQTMFFSGLNEMVSHLMEA